jgi:hypothetical protein
LSILLVSCVFSRQIWALVLQKLNLLALAPQPPVGRFSSWWSATIYQVPKKWRQSFNSLVILGYVWFDGWEGMKRDGMGSSHFLWCLVGDDPQCKDGVNGYDKSILKKFAD